MLKEKVEGILGGAVDELATITREFEEIEKSGVYSSEHLNALRQELDEKQQGIKQKAIADITKAFDDVIEKEKKKAVAIDDLKTSNTLKAIELAKNTLTAEEIEAILKENSGNKLVTRALYGIAQERNIAIEKEPDVVEKLEAQKKELISHISTQRIDDLKTSLLMHYL